MTFPILSFMTFFPMVGALVILCLPTNRPDLVKKTALATTIPPLLAAVWLFGAFDRTVAGMQFIEGPMAWIPAFHINYTMAADGLSITMILLTALISTICIPASWGINKQVKGYFALFLLLDTGMMGVFCAMDFFLFYVFWEVMLLPMYFLIGIWGGPRREYAAIKFFLYALLGSVLMLLVMLAFYFYSDGNSFDLLQLRNLSLHNGLLAVPYFRQLCWFGLFIAFAIKVPTFPFHTWLPDAHVEAPTAISVILAGVLLKMGIYGMLRFNYPLLPDVTAKLVWLIALIGAINIIYGALCAMAQKDFKKLIAYSSISHMGFCMLGIASLTTEGINGAVLQMFNHGTITAMLFLLVGVVYDRAHHREISGFGGLATSMPQYATITALAFFAAMGLPGLSGFVSEILVFLGAFKNWRVLTIVSASGVVLTAAYMLWTYQRIFFGKLNEKYQGILEINSREVWTLAPLAVIVVILGVYPRLALDMINLTLVSINAGVEPYWTKLSGLAGL